MIFFLRIFLKTKGTEILSYHVEHYTLKMDIIRYYLLPKSTALKLTKNKIPYMSSVFILFY